MELKTPLYDCHVALGGKIIPFAGYLLPVQYDGAGVIEEHMAVREKAGLFDVSHMAEIILSGPDALNNLNNLLTNDFTNMADGRVRYSPMCNERGGIVDDMVIYRMSPERYMVVANAANRHKVVGFMREHLLAGGDVKLEDISDTVAQIALQGPKSRDILLRLSAPENIPAKYYTFIESVEISGIKCILSQTGYTGELGYEFYCRSEDAPKLWGALLDTGAEYGLIPCGLGARDTLRLEAGMPLYGHEMTDDISPLEAALGFAVKMQKDSFIGKEGIERSQSGGKAPKRIRVGLKMTGRGIAREDNPVLLGGRQIGVTTSGTHLPYLRGAYAMALVETDSSGIETAVQVEVRGRIIDAEIVPLPFYKR
jgi:aminomethyltransferase